LGGSIIYIGYIHKITLESPAQFEYLRSLSWWRLSWTSWFKLRWGSYSPKKSLFLSLARHRPPDRDLLQTILSLLLITQPIWNSNWTKTLIRYSSSGYASCIPWRLDRHVSWSQVGQKVTTTNSPFVPFSLEGVRNFSLGL